MPFVYRNSNHKPNVRGKQLLVLHEESDLGVNSKRNMKPIKHCNCLSNGAQVHGVELEFVTPGVICFSCITRWCDLTRLNFVLSTTRIRITAGYSSETRKYTIVEGAEARKINRDSTSLPLKREAEEGTWCRSSNISTGSITSITQSYVSSNLIREPEIAVDCFKTGDAVQTSAGIFSRTEQSATGQGCYKSS